MYVALALGGVSLLTILILIMVMISTRRHLTAIQSHLKKITQGGYEYPLPLAPVPPILTKDKNQRSRSPSSVDSGVQSDQCDASTENSGSRTSTPNGPSTPVTARQNTYVHDNGNDPNNAKSSYEHLNSDRENNGNYERIRSRDSYEHRGPNRASTQSYQQPGSQSSYEKASSNRNSCHKYLQIQNADVPDSYAQLSDDTVSRRSSHDYEVLPGTNSQPGSKSGSLRSRANVPLSIAEQKEENEM